MNSSFYLFLVDSVISFVFVGVMMNRAVVRKFIPIDLPIIPTSSPGTGSTALRGLSSSAAPSSTTLSSYVLVEVDLPPKLPIIDVSTSPEVEGENV